MLAKQLSQQLYQGVSTLWEQGLFTDVTLRCQGQAFRAHRLVLASHSSQLQELLAKAVEQDVVLDLDQCGCTVDCLETLLDFLYTGNIVVTDDRCGILRKVASVLKITCLLTLLDASKVDSNEIIPEINISKERSVDTKERIHHVKPSRTSKTMPVSGGDSAQQDSEAPHRDYTTNVLFQESPTNLFFQESSITCTNLVVNTHTGVSSQVAAQPIRKKRGRPRKSGAAIKPVQRSRGREESGLMTKVNNTVSKLNTGTRKRKLKTEKGAPKCEEPDQCRPGTWCCSDPDEDPLALQTDCAPSRVAPPDGTPKKTPHRVMKREGWRGDPVCDVCDKRFTTHMNCTQHIKAEHPESWTGGNLCPLCGKTFTRHSSWKGHMRDFHGEKYQCPHCDQFYSGRGTLKVHIDAVHISKMAPPQHICETCGKKFYTNMRLWFHKQIHGEPKECKHCGKLLSTAKSLARHVRVKHKGQKQNPGKTYPCEICDKVLRTRASHRIHVQAIHTRTNDPTFLKFVCDHCGSRFYNRHKLDRHIKSMHKLSLPGNA